VKLLFAISLIAIQLLSGGVAPVYLCLCCDGSIYFDEGPESSECRAVTCRVEESECACCAHDQCHHEIRTSAPIVEGMSSIGGECGCCTHLPVSGSRTPTLSSGRQRVDAAKLRVWVYSFSCERMIGLPAAESQLRLRSKTLVPLPSFALLVLGSVNLRC
jgi:hypothetical protein